MALYFMSCKLLSGDTYKHLLDLGNWDWQMVWWCVQSSVVAGKFSTGVPAIAAITCVGAVAQGLALVLLLFKQQWVSNIMFFFYKKLHITLWKEKLVYFWWHNNAELIKPFSVLREGPSSYPILQRFFNKILRPLIWSAVPFLFVFFKGMGEDGLTIHSSVG